MAEAPRFQAPTGTFDVLPPASARWQELLARFAGVVGGAGYGLVINPLFEDVGVFLRGIGEGSDVVTKEMYEFVDKGDRRLALRPEGTASVVRAFVQHRPPVPFKAWYATPAFRYERPQAGRYRQHHQLGIEALGSEDPDLDVEVVALGHDFYRSLGLQQVTVKLNSMGDRDCLPAYRTALAGYLEARAGDLCAEHREKWRANPLRVLDCKKPECRAATADAPKTVDLLCEPCRKHFERVRTGLDDIGIAPVLDFRLVRGFDYYTRTTFEFVAEALSSAQNAIGGGGRYDGLVESLGGPATPGIGFGMGIERLLLACDAEGVMAAPAAQVDVFVVDVTGGAQALSLTTELRRAGVRTDRAFDGRSMKAQLRAADRSGAAVAVIIGEDEVTAGTAVVKAMSGGARQQAVARAEVVSTVRGLLTGSAGIEEFDGEGTA
ncbi:MAG TPA: histidine--tRNA ligase [Acidimicrobiales bacterium]|nr:histidine--tRNA ligase [Acidimicrobiales bacterium]